MLILHFTISKVKTGPYFRGGDKIMTKETLFLILSFLLVSFGEAYLAEACTSKSSNYLNSCFMNLDCKSLQSLAQGDILNHTECCQSNDFKLSIKIELNFETVLSNQLSIHEPPLVGKFACLGAIKKLDLLLLGLRGIRHDFDASKFGNLPTQLNIQYSSFTILNQEGKEAPCPSRFSIFNASSSLLVDFTLGNKYSENVCQEIFTDAKLERLGIHETCRSMIMRNAFTIGRPAKSSDQNIASQINTFHLNGYLIDLNEKVFQPNVFGRTKVLIISGILSTFDARIVKDSRLEEISLRIIKITEFLHNNVNWLQFANERLTRSPLDIRLADPLAEPGLNAPYLVKLLFKRPSHQYLSIYQVNPEHKDTFDDAQFCVFFHIAKNRLNVRFKGLLIESKGQTKCSCTLFWLTWNLMPGSHEQYRLDYYPYLPECMKDSARLFADCDFDKMQQSCSLTTNATQMNAEPTFYIWLAEIKFTEYLSSVFLGPGVGLLGLLVNLLVCYTFRKIKNSPEYRKSKLTDKSRHMWDYVNYNSALMAAQAFIMMLQPLTACIAYNGIYCSPLALTHFGQAFYLFVESLTPNALKIVSNLTAFMFALYRYSLNTDRMPLIRELKPKKVLIASMAAAGFFSSVALFVNDRFSIYILSRDKFEYLSRDSLLDMNESFIMKLLYILNLFLSSILFSGLTLVVDTSLLFNLKRQKKEKRSKDIAEVRVTKMIILNGLFTLLFRIPEFLLSIIMIAFTFDQRVFTVCILKQDPIHSLCPVLFRLVHFVYSFTFFEHFALLILFNRKFRSAVNDIFSRPK
nr:G protein-coupled receptor [Proales similis]